jgi:hypothetical protein
MLCRPWSTDRPFCGGETHSKLVQNDSHAGEVEGHRVTPEKLVSDHRRDMET